MAYLSEIRDNRLLLLQYFLSDQELVDLLTSENEYTAPAFELKFTQIFPYPWTGGTTTEKKAFLCFKLSSRSMSKQTKKTAIRIYVFMHESLMVMPNCLRQDAILARIERLLNGNEDMGITDVEFVGFDQLDGLPKEYYGVWVEYNVNNINRWTC